MSVFIVVRAMRFLNCNHIERRIWWKRNKPTRDTRDSQDTKTLEMHIIYLAPFRTLVYYAHARLR